MQLKLMVATHTHHDHVNGVEALQALESQDYALVLMDCDMPEMDGLEATRRIRAQGQKYSEAGLPIIALTAHVFDENREACDAAGMNDFLEKPLDLKHLKQVFEKWLPSSGPASQTRPD